MLRLRDRLENFSFAIPALAIFSVFYVYPFFKVFQLSLYEWNGVSSAMQFVGLRHFYDLISSDPVHWWDSMGNAFYITVWALVFQNSLALSLALACDRAIRRNAIYRVIFFLPPILSEVVVGLVWKWIFNGDYGLLNHWLMKLGLGEMAKDWLSNPQTALTCVALVHCWKGFGWGFVILLAGLQNIPQQLYEAARVDGANAWHSFTKVTIPLMIPVFILVSILTILGSMQGFVLILSTTGGGPGFHTEVPITRIIASMRGNLRFGFACAQGIIFGLILLVISFVQLSISKRLKRA